MPRNYVMFYRYSSTSIYCHPLNYQCQVDFRTPYLLDQMERGEYYVFLYYHTKIKKDVQICFDKNGKNVTLFGEQSPMISIQIFFQMGIASVNDTPSIQKQLAGDHSMNLVMSHDLIRVLQTVLYFTDWSLKQSIFNG